MCVSWCGHQLELRLETCLTVRIKSSLDIMLEIVQIKQPIILLVTCKQQHARALTNDPETFKRHIYIVVEVGALFVRFSLRVIGEMGHQILFREHGIPLMCVK